MIAHEETMREQERAERERAEAPHDGNTIPGLLKNLRDELTGLFRQEVALARGEVTENARDASRHIVTMAIGGGVALAGLVVLLMGFAAAAAAALVAAGVEEGVAVWLGPLLLGAIVVAIGFGMLQAALKRLQHTSLVPQRTVQTLRDDSNWAKHKLQQT